MGTTATDRVIVTLAIMGDQFTVINGPIPPRAGNAGSLRCTFVRFLNYRTSRT